MKIKVMLFSLVALLLTGCTTVEPHVGEEAVLIKKPRVFGDGGIDPVPIKTGLTYVAPTTEFIMVNMQPLQFEEHLEDLMSLDGVPLDFDAIIRVRIQDSVKMISKFGPEWYKVNVQKEFRNRIRQAVRKHGMNETAISTAAIDSIDDEISTAMRKYFQEAGLPLELIQMTVGKANPPPEVMKWRIETAAQEQKAITEGKRKLAEDVRLHAEESRAKADNAFRDTMQLNPNQFLELERIKMQHAVCSTGKCSFIITDGRTTPIVNTH